MSEEQLWSAVNTLREQAARQDGDIRVTQARTQALEAAVTSMAGSVEAIREALTDGFDEVKQELRPLTAALPIQCATRLEHLQRQDRRMDELDASQAEQGRQIRELQAEGHRFRGWRDVAMLIWPILLGAGAWIVSHFVSQGGGK